MNNCEKILGKIFFVLTIIMFLYITVFSFLFSWINTNVSDENVYFVRDSVVLNIVGLTVVVTLLIFQKRYIEKKSNINTKVLAIIVSFISMVISLYWVLTSGTAPAHDQSAICEAASQMAHGDYQYFQDGEYMARFPHQWGLLTVMRLMFFLFGDGNYTSYRVLSAILVFVIVYGGYLIVKELSNGSTFAEIVSLEISFLCLPMYLYTDFVYGEIPSIGFMVIACELVIKIFQKPTVGRILGLGGAIYATLLFRRNSVIFCIAILVAMFIKVLFSSKKKSAIAIILITIAVMAIYPITINSLYKDKLPEGAESVPTILWISMGTNEEGNFAGWYDGSVLIIFRESGNDAEVAAEKGKEILRDFFVDCKNNPAHCIKFYLKKTTSQWDAPMFQGIVMNNTIVSEQTPLAKLLYNEDNWKFLEGFMNIYQLVIYIGIIIYLLVNFKRAENLELYIGLITIYGGFLSSIIWEAKTRYVLPYFMMMLPYAVLGISELLEAEEKKDDTF